MTDLPSGLLTGAAQPAVPAASRAQAQVLAWARGNQTGQLRYILELTAHERGDACDCSCVSCGQPLQAVNAARLDGQLRPHFRHRAGLDHSLCQIQSARAALLASLAEGDGIVLPGSRRMLTLTGLSGAQYHGWVETGSETICVRRRDFIDVTTAELLLDDGRRLLVKVVGSAEQTAPGAFAGDALIPRIEIVIDDPQFAMLAPAELRARLFPALGAGNWCGHWPDPAADAAALAQAQADADQLLDWYDGPEEVPEQLRGESVLHREVMAILASATELAVPGWKVTDAGKLATDVRRVEKQRLNGARLEKKLGRIIPDVIATLADGGELLIEVTVTNIITAERLERIRAVDLPTLEIDFVRMHGVLSRDALRLLVLERIDGKTWLHHPAAARLPPRMVDDDSVLFGWQLIKHVGGRRGAIQARPVEVWAESYLQAVRELARIDFVVDPAEFADPKEARSDAMETLLTAADALHAHGYPEALDHRLFDDDYQRTVLHRLMSILTGSPVGYRQPTVWQVLNSLFAETVPERLSWHALYLIALEAKPAGVTRAQDERLEAWRRQVRQSLRSGDELYRRDPRNDRLFALLFPELVPDLDVAMIKKERAPAPMFAMVTMGDDNIDPKYFHEPDIHPWVWMTEAQTRTQALALASSRARLDGFAVDHDSVLYHLNELGRTSSPVSNVIRNVAIRSRTEDAIVARYLCRNGYIGFPQGHQHD